MGKPKIDEKVIDTIKNLRRAGKSVKEIVNQLKLGTGTVSKYCKDVYLDSKARDILEAKKYPAKRLSKQEKENSKTEASKIIKSLNSRDTFLVFTALYWGEGTKRELNLINGDPELVSFFVRGLLSLGIDKERIKISIRLYPFQDEETLSLFWTKKLALHRSNIVGFERVEGGKKIHKLKYGMCRVRVEKGSYYHKLVMSSIQIISSGSSNG